MTHNPQALPPQLSRTVEILLAQLLADVRAASLRPETFTTLAPNIGAGVNMLFEALIGPIPANLDARLARLERDEHLDNHPLNDPATIQVLAATTPTQFAEWLANRGPTTETFVLPTWGAIGKQVRALYPGEHIPAEAIATVVAHEGFYCTIEYAGRQERYSFSEIGEL